MSEFAEASRRARIERLSVEQLRDIVLRVDRLLPTHRHRGPSWGSGDAEYVAYDAIRAALRPESESRPLDRTLCQECARDIEDVADLRQERDEARAIIERVRRECLAEHYWNDRGQMIGDFLLFAQTVARLCDGWQPASGARRNGQQ